MVVLTVPLKEMLGFVREFPGYRPKFYAEQMWGRKRAHQNARNASKLLWRLERWGLVEQHDGYWSPTKEK